MRLFLLSALILSFLLLSGCATIQTGDINIETAADNKVDFSGYTSYAWFAAAGILRDPEGKWEPPGFDADAEIQFLVNREFRKRGLTETGNNPDFLVAYVLGVNMTALKLKEIPESNIRTLENVPKGALVLLLIDPQSSKAIWAGLATAETQQGLDRETRKKRLDYVITNMLRQLPE